MPVRDLAREAVVTAPPTATATHLAELMAVEDVGSVVIVDETDPIGIVTDRDLTIGIVREGNDPAEVTAENVMTPDPFTIEADAGVYDALSEMAEANVRRVPVIASDGTLTGIVTMDDFVVLLVGELERVSDIVQSESPPY